MDIISKLLVLNILIVTATSQSCYFDFEDNSELDNFDLTCNGQIGAWVIKDRNQVGAPLADAGDRVLTVAERQATSCLKSQKMIEVNENQQMTVDIFRKKPTYSDFYDLKVSLRCDGSENYEWTVLDGSEEPSEGEWISLRHTFETLENRCQLEMLLYIGGGNAEVEIDRIVLNDLSTPEQCYVVPKPTSSTSTTEISTTTVTSTEETTTETTPVTTTETTPITIEDTTPKTTMETTPITTMETTPITTMETTPITTMETTPITTEDTTPITTTETTPITTMETTTIPTMETTPITTTEIKPTVTTETTTPQSTPPSSTTTENSSTSLPTNSTTPEPPETATPTITPPQQTYPAFSMFYFVVIIATSGMIVILSLATCWFILRKTRTRKNQHIS